MTEPSASSELRDYRSVIWDNRRWQHFTHRPGDIFVCSPPKCGTTWMQTIVISLHIGSYWARRDDPNLCFVHYDDMTADLEGEMRRVAGFLEIDVDDELWPAVVDRCTFAAMKARPDEISPFDRILEGGADAFLYKATNGRWRDVLTADEVAAYERRVRELLSADAVTWLAGRTP